MSPFWIFFGIFEVVVIVWFLYELVNAPLVEDETEEDNKKWPT